MRAATRSAASDCNPWITCWYVCQVTSGLEWPSRSETILTSTPATSARVAQVWRRSCRRMRGRSEKLAWARRRSNVLEKRLRVVGPAVGPAEDETLVVVGAADEELLLSLAGLPAAESGDGTGVQFDHPCLL